MSYKTFDERMAAKRARKPNRKQRRQMLMQVRRSMQTVATVGSRLLKRVRRRREIDGADWLKQMRRQQRSLAELRPPRTPEQKAAIAIKNEDTDAGPMVERYKSLPTPEQLDAQREARNQTRVKDKRSSKRR